MYNNYQNESYNEHYSPDITASRSNISGLTKVFLWMFAGILVTGLVMIAVASITPLLMIALSPFFMITIGIVQVVIAISLTKNALMKVNKKKATTLFFVYSVLTGFLFSIFYLLVPSDMMIMAITLTGGMFLAMAVAGSIFKEKFIKIGNFLFVGLIFLLVASLISYFVGGALYAAVSFIGLGIFLLLTAFDVARIQMMLKTTGTPESFVIYGAFMLYLDFINIFIYVLRIILASRN